MKGILGQKVGGQALALAAFFLLVLAALFTGSQTLGAAAIIGFFCINWLFLGPLLSGIAVLARAGIAYALSFSSLCAITYVISLVLGYSRGLIAVAMVVVAATLALLSSNSGKTQGKKAFATGILSELKAHYAIIIATILVFAAFISINNATLWADSEYGIIVGGWNWGDFPAHVPVIRTVNLGNFPPQVPFLAGEPLNYHWFSDFFTAINAKFTGIDQMACMRVENSIYPAFFFLLCYLVALRLCADRKKALFAALLVLFCGSLAFTKVLPQLWGNPGQAWNTITYEAHDNDWGEYQMPSLIPGFLLPQRAIMAGLVLFLASLLLVLESKGDWKKNALAGLLCGLSVPFHFYAAPACGLAAVLKAVIDTLSGQKIAKSAKHLGFFSLGAAVAGVPLYLLVLSTGIHSSSYPLALHFGWLAPTDAVGFAAFYAKNLGIAFVAFVLAAIAFAAALPGKQKKFAGVERGEYALLCLLGLGLFVVPNLLTLPGLDWDLNKFFVFMFVPTGICAGFAAYDFAKRLRTWGWILLAVFFLISSLSSLMTTAWWDNNRWVGLTAADVEVGQWIANNTPVGTVFASHEKHNSPIDSYAGRFRAVGAWWGWVNAIGDGENGRRIELMKRFFCTQSEAEALSIAHGLNATYAYYSQDEKDSYKCDPGFARWRTFTQAYSKDGTEIYRIDG
ncbi:MAG: hypothetical protein WCX64_02345 [Candidatus Micrarchaeia archaeon]